MTREQLQQIRAIVYDAYCEGDTEAEWMLAVIDADLAAEQEPVAYMLGDDDFADARCYEPREGDIPLYTHPMPEPAAPPPDTWDGAEEWERLAFELCADEHGEESCNELIWSDNEPWGDRWLKYEDEAKRMISLVRKHTAPVAAPQREWQGLTPDEINDCAGAEIYPSTWAMAFARAIKSKLKEKNHG